MSIHCMTQQTMHLVFFKDKFTSHAFHFICQSIAEFISFRQVHEGWNWTSDLHFDRRHCPKSVSPSCMSGNMQSVLHYTAISFRVRVSPKWQLFESNPERSGLYCSKAIGRAINSMQTISPNSFISTLNCVPFSVSHWRKYNASIFYEIICYLILFALRIVIVLFCR